MFSHFFNTKSHQIYATLEKSPTQLAPSPTTSSTPLLGIYIPHCINCTWMGLCNWSGMENQDEQRGVVVGLALKERTENEGKLGDTEVVKVLWRNPGIQSLLAFSKRRRFVDFTYSNCERMKIMISISTANCFTRECGDDYIPVSLSSGKTNALDQSLEIRRE